VDLLTDLNPQQRAAVTFGDGAMLVFAGAGSGKTRVITHRIAHRVADHGVRPWSILAVTFTNKAAGEMRARIARILGDAGRGAWIGTFHATCARLLRELADEAELDRHFVIFDDGDQQAVLRRVVKDLGLDERRFSPRWLAGRIDQAKQECLGPDQVDAPDPWTQAFVEAYRTYEARMKASRAVDFGDLIYRSVRLLEARPDVLSRLRARFQHILVDEFQDTNHAQYRLVRLLGAGHGNVCAVGDDDQSIYRWRGADIRNIRSFREDFAGTTVFKLEQNYRSTGRILAAAHGVIAKSPEREPKELFTENPEGRAIDLLTVDNERVEAMAVVEWIRVLRGEGMAHHDLAVFYRTNAQSRVLEEALRTARVPYAVYGGMRFYERAEIKDIVSYLRVIQNPHSDVDLLRVVNVPTRGIGKTTLDALSETATARGTSVWDVLVATCDDPAATPAVRKKLAVFRDLVVDWQAHAPTLGIAALTRSVLDLSGYEEWLANDPSIEAEARRGNMAELVGSMEAFEHENEDPTLPSFLETVALQAGQDEVKDDDRVSLMTIHTAKGLEFSAVAVVGMEEDLFPMRRQDSTDPQDLEEERRLCYVAITRARQRLLLTNTVYRRIFGQERFPVPSRFLADIPANVIVDRSPRRSVSSTGALPSLRVDRPMGPRGDRFVAPFAAERPLAPPSRPTTSTERFIDRSESQVPVWDEDSGAPFQVGQTVRHATFGIGRVRSVEAGVDIKLRVEFPGVGQKVIVARFLQPA
jgi:DNA helicase II / ATP-dependent DNA helicase PcrA